MKRYLMSGGGPGRIEWDGTYNNVYGFEHVQFFFNRERWQGGYCNLQEVISRPERHLKNVDFWWVSLNYSDRDIAGPLNAACDYARSRGCIVLGEPNGGYHPNLFMVAPAVRDIWCGCTVMGATTPNPDMIRAYERVYGRPAFGSPPPVNVASHMREVRMMEQVQGELPPRIEESFMLGTVPSHGNLFTIQACELMGIPLVVTGDHGDPFVNCWKTVVEQDQGGFRYVQWLPHLHHYHWLWLIKNSRGILHLNWHPSTGRYTMYAALLGKISLSNRTAWQEILFPEAIMPSDATGFINVLDYERRAQEAMQFVPDRLAEYAPAKCQDRLDEFIARLPNNDVAAAA